MLNYLPEFIAVATLHLLAVMSPGPDFIMISRNSLVYSRRAGVYASLGLALGILMHVTYSLIGVAYIISQSIVVFSAIKFLGAVYLIYIGYNSLLARRRPEAMHIQAEARDMRPSAALKLGFLTNALNPKATLFFLAVFTQVINQSTPVVVKIFYGLEMSVATFVWFAFVALVLSSGRVRAPFIKVQHYVERTMGAMLIALGIKVALSQK